MIHETEMKIFTSLAVTFIIIRGAFPNTIAMNQFSYPHTIFSDMLAFFDDQTHAT